MKIRGKVVKKKLEKETEINLVIHPLKEITESLERNSLEYGLKVNKAKTKVIRIDRPTGNQTHRRRTADYIYKNGYQNVLRRCPVPNFHSSLFPYCWSKVSSAHYFPNFFHLGIPRSLFLPLFLGHPIPDLLGKSFIWHPTNMAVLG